MSSITMAADSTQSDAKHRARHKSKYCHQSQESSRKETYAHKNKHVKTSHKKNKAERDRGHADESCSDRESDLDLSKELLPISGYVDKSEQMVEHMFRSISMKKLKAMLPEILKPIPLDQLKSLCVGQLEGMSKKRICRILDGDDPEGISSSGTEDNDEKEIPGAEQQQLGESKVIGCNVHHTHEVPEAKDISVPKTKINDKAAVHDDSSVNCVQGTDKNIKAKKANRSMLLGDEKVHSQHTLANDVSDVKELDSVEEAKDEDKFGADASSPASLPSLVSEPEDTCVPFTFHRMNSSATVNNTSEQKSASAMSEVAVAPFIERGHIEQSTEHEFAVAENENNVNIENETSINDNVRDVAERHVDVNDVSSRDDLQHVVSSCVPDKTTATVTGDENEEVVIDIQDHEFSDEDSAVASPSCRRQCEPGKLSEQVRSSEKAEVGVEHDQRRSQPLRKSRIQEGHTDCATGQHVVAAKRKNSGSSELLTTPKMSKQITVLLNQASPEHRQCQLISGDQESVGHRIVDLASNSIILSPEGANKLPLTLDMTCNSAHIVDKRSSASQDVPSSHISYSNVTYSNLSPCKTDSNSSKHIAVLAHSEPHSNKATPLKPTDSGCVTAPSGEQNVKSDSPNASSENVEASDNKKSTKSSETTLSTTQLEILELEMRARAIRAMLRAQEDLDEDEQKSANEEKVVVATDKDIDTRTASSSNVSSVRRRVVVQQPVSRRLVRHAEWIANRKRQTDATTSGGPNLQRLQQPSDEHTPMQTGVSSPRRSIQIKSTVSAAPSRRQVVLKTLDSAAGAAVAPRMIRVSPVSKECSSLRSPEVSARQRRSADQDSSIIDNASSWNTMRQVVLSPDHRVIQTVRVPVKRHRYLGNQSTVRPKFRKFQRSYLQ